MSLSQIPTSPTSYHTLKFPFSPHLHTFPPLYWLHDIYYNLNFLFNNPETLIVTDIAGVPPASWWYSSLHGFLLSGSATLHLKGCLGVLTVGCCPSVGLAWKTGIWHTGWVDTSTNDQQPLYPLGGMMMRYILNNLPKFTMGLSSSCPQWLPAHYYTLIGFLSPLSYTPTPLCVLPGTNSQINCLHSNPHLRVLFGGSPAYVGFFLFLFLSSSFPPPPPSLSLFWNLNIFTTFWN